MSLALMMENVQIQLVLTFVAAKRDSSSLQNIGNVSMLMNVYQKGIQSQR